MSDKRNYRNHRGIVKDVIPIKSKAKGTPGLEFEIDVDEVKEGEEFVTADAITRNVTIYFPTSSAEAREISLRKLRRAGWPGGGLDSVGKALIDQRVEVVSFEEEYEGEWKTKWDFPSGQFKSERSEDAGLTIDAILMSAPVDSSAAAEPALAGAASKAPPMDDDDSVPF